MRFTRTRTGALALGALVLLAAGLLAWRHAPDDAPASPAPLQAEPAARVTAMPSAPVPARTPAPFPPVPDEPPLSVQVERLLATHDPHDALSAYWLTANCARFNADGDRLMPGFRTMTDEEKRHDARFCAGMTERERQSRLDYLAVAVKAGIPGAAVAFLDEGPFGDRSALKTRPDDPLVKEWKENVRAAMTQAAESGMDKGAMFRWAFDHSIGSDVVEENPALAYRYALALGLVERDTAGPNDDMAREYAADGHIATAFGAPLTAQQRAAELAAAEAIAARARDARKHAP